MVDKVESNVNMCDEVMSAIVGVAATSVEGVRAISGGLTKKKIPYMDGKHLKKGIQVEGDGKGLKVGISLVLNNNANLQKTCFNVQEKVKETLEGMMNVVVKDVMIRVENIVEDNNEK